METLKIIKIGGNIIDNKEALSAFLKKFSMLEGPKLLVHGGGKLATELAHKMKVEVKMLKGRRITDLPTLDIIVMMYAGKINKQIVAQLQAHRCNAIGFTGADGNSIVSVKRPKEPIDFGFVGDVIQVNTEVLETLVNQNITPVFCAITHDHQGQLLNTNADTIASELAIALASTYSVELFYCFEKNGVLTDISNDNSVIHTLDFQAYHTLFQQGKIADGMIPKLDNCFNSLRKKVSKVCIGKPEMIFDSNSIHTTLQL